MFKSLKFRQWTAVHVLYVAVVAFLIFILNFQPFYKLWSLVAQECSGGVAFEKYGSFSACANAVAESSIWGIRIKNLLILSIFGIPFTLALQLYRQWVRDEK